MTANPKFKTIHEILAIMKAEGYDDEQLVKVYSWYDAGRTVLVFENHDLGHYALGHKIAMPWDDAELPPHGPDHPNIGMGWRYITAYAARPEPETIVDVGPANALTDEARP